MKPLIQCLLSEPYPELLEQECGMKDEAVQDVFRLTCQPSHRMVPSFPLLPMCLCQKRMSPQSCPPSVDWDSAPQLRTASLGDHLPDMVIPSLDAFTALSAADPLSYQTQDPSVSRVLYFVERKGRPSRRERCHESWETLHLLRHWGKQILLDGSLYWVSKDPLE